MDLITYLLLLGAIALGAIGQLLLKLGMLRHSDFRLVQVLTLVHDLPIVGGFCFYSVSVLLYFRVLAQADLSIVFPTVSLGYALTVILSRLVFKEVVRPGRWLAVVIICLGVAIVGLGA